jgi:hypothetical protein
MTFATLDTTCTRSGGKGGCTYFAERLRELTLEEMLASPGVRQLMRRDGVDLGTSGR